MLFATSGADTIMGQFAKQAMGTKANYVANK